MENRGWKVDHDSWKQMITGFALKSCGFASKKICPTTLGRVPLLMRKMANGLKIECWVNLFLMKLLPSSDYPWVPPMLRINWTGRQRGMDVAPPNLHINSFQRRQRRKLRAHQHNTSQAVLVGYLVTKFAKQNLILPLVSIKRFSADKTEFNEEEHHSKFSLWPLLLWDRGYHSRNLGLHRGKKNVCWELERCRPFLAKKLICFRDLFQGILAQKIPHLAELFSYIAWSIWHNRNARRVGTTTVPLGKIYSDAVERYHEFRKTQDIPSQQKNGGPPNTLVTSSANLVQS